MILRQRPLDFYDVSFVRQKIYTPPTFNGVMSASYLLFKE